MGRACTRVCVCPWLLDHGEKKRVATGSDEKAIGVLFFDEKATGASVFWATPEMIPYSHSTSTLYSLREIIP